MSPSMTKHQSSKKGFGVQYYFLIAAFFIGITIYYVATLKYEFKGYVGEAALYLQDARSQSYDISLYMGISSQFSATSAAYALGKSGAGARCSSYLGYALWTVEDGKKSCTPTQTDIEAQFSTLFLNTLDRLLEMYQPYVNAFLPSNNFDISFPSSKEIRLTAKNGILIPIGEGIDIRPKEAPSILQQIGVTKQEQLPSSSALTLPPSPDFPTLTPAQVNDFFRKRKSPLTGIGELFSAIEQRTQVPSSVLLSIATTESGLKHCCLASGKNSGTSCTAVASPSCTSSTILSSSSGSVGLMQINVQVNAALAKKVCRSDESVYDLECNINIAAKLLRDSYLRHQNGISRNLINKYCKDPLQAEKYSSYQGWDAAIRAYNGLGCNTKKGADVAYVENVHQKIAQIPSVAT